MLPPAVEEVYAPIETQVATLHVEWLFYRQLFGTSPDRIDVLNASAPAIFVMIDAALWKIVLLGFARLADPASTRVKGVERPNLSLEHLQSRVEAHDAATGLTTRPLLDAFKASCTEIKDWRNRYVAHADLVTMLGDPNVLLPGISRQRVEQALTALQEYLNAICRGFQQQPVAWSFGVDPAPGTGEDLLRHLQTGTNALARSKVPTTLRDQLREAKGTMQPMPPDAWQDWLSPEVVGMWKTFTPEQQAALKRQANDVATAARWAAP